MEQPESGVPYSRLHEWLKNPDKTIHSGHVERLMDTLGLRVSRGAAAAKPTPKAAK